MSPACRLWLNRTAGAVLAVCLLGVVVVKAAPAETVLIKSRQDKLRDMGGAFKAIDDELKKRSPDWDNIVLPNAQTVQERSSYLLNWFPKGSGPESNTKTYALGVIWQKPDDFTKLGKTAAAEAAKLNQIAGSKNADALRAQVVVVGKACKACHDTYRSPDYEKDNED